MAACAFGGALGSRSLLRRRYHRGAVAASRRSARRRSACSGSCSTSTPRCRAPAMTRPVELVPGTRARGRDARRSCCRFVAAAGAARPRPSRNRPGTPYHVALDAQGKPVPFTVAATGFPFRTAGLRRAVRRPRADRAELVADDRLRHRERRRPLNADAHGVAVSMLPTPRPSHCARSPGRARRSSSTASPRARRRRRTGCPTSGTARSASRRTPRGHRRSGVPADRVRDGGVELDVVRLVERSRDPGVIGIVVVVGLVVVQSSSVRRRPALAPTQRPPRSERSAEMR